MTRHEFTPLKISVAWVLGTFVAFLLLGQTQKIDNLFQLSVFVLAAVGCLIGGYWLRIIRYRRATAFEDPALTSADRRMIRRLVGLSAAYYAAYAFVYARQFGIGGPSSLITALRDPGTAYITKFDALSAMQTSGTNDPAAQMITLVAVLSAPLVPFLVVYWSQITPPLKAAAFVGLSLYAGLFLAIGTLVGLGNILLYSGAAYLVVRARPSDANARRRRGGTVLVVAGVLAFAGYMAYNQADRIQTVGIAYRYEPNPIVKTLTGSDALARGVTLTAFYPTHGYQGLSYNLERPFVWTHGRGASRALDSYLDQYGFGDSVSTKTYPARTQTATGWDAGVYWATIFPWLASDLTFPGAALFMGFAGWWLARFWYETVVLDRKLSLLLLTQMSVFIAFIPANNQLGLSRPGLITLATLIALYVMSGINRRLAARTRGADHQHSAREPIPTVTRLRL